MRLHGFGFVNASQELKTKLHHVVRGPLSCAGTGCIQVADYIDKATIESGTYPQREVNFKDNNENIKLDGMAIEASVVGNAFTENNIEIWYYEQPDYLSTSISGTPANQEKPIFTKTNFKWNVNDIDRFQKFGNFSCRFTSLDGKKVVYTKARMEIYPLGSASDEGDLPTHVKCYNPIWKTPEQVKLDISVNG